MANPRTEAIVVHCIDFRFQEYLDAWIDTNFGYGLYNRVSLAGGILDFETVLKQVKISLDLHSIKKAVLINHEDCGAYGKAGDYARHKSDLQEAKQKLEALFPHLKVETYYLRIGGEFERL